MSFHLNFYSFIIPHQTQIVNSTLADPDIKKGEVSDTSPISKEQGTLIFYSIDANKRFGSERHAL